jgi:16S rRNA (adenine1518-N6/adenine1519-N6)-dimethyltransferase
VEIGPGRGALTGALLETGKRVVAVEPDLRMVDYLQSRYGSELHLVHASLLNVAAKDLLPEGSERAVLVGNLPYNLSGPIMEWIFQSAAHWQKAVIMLQLEVARRLVAPPATRDFGPLAIACALHFTAAKRFLVRPGSFFPPPEVTSAVVELSPCAKPPVAVRDRAAFMRFVHMLFAYRRKNLRNNLMTAVGGETREWDDVFQSVALDGRLRAEQLQWQNLTDLHAAARPLLERFEHGS